jgi:hypothetical protein
MFGGFDGAFYNDLNILDFQSAQKQIVKFADSSLSIDYQSLINQKDSYDIRFVLDNSQNQEVFGHKALVLFRAIQRELKQDELPLSK